jgi:hypothetical protein
VQERAILSLKIKVPKKSKGNKMCKSGQEESKIGAQNQICARVTSDEIPDHSILSCRGVLAKVIVSDYEQQLIVDVNLRDPRCFAKT